MTVDNGASPHALSQDNIIVANRGTTSTLVVQAFSSRGQRLVDCSIPAFIQVGQWMHVAVVIDKSRVTVYKDANYKRSSALLAPVPSTVRTRNFVGRSNWKGDALFKGDIDVFRFVSGKAWSQIQVRQSMSER